MISYSTLHPHAKASIVSLSFIKEDEICYAHLPEFLHKGLGTKANLMMVDGADTFLDLLSNNGTMISLQLSSEPIPALKSMDSNEIIKELKNILEFPNLKI